MTKKYVCCAPYLRKHTSCHCHLWSRCVKWYISKCFFHFFKILIFWVVSGVKVQKMVPNDKKFCLSLQSQESYIIWLSFVVHLCEMMISSGIFLFFQNFGFLGCYGGAKNGPKWEKILLCSIFQEPCIIWFSFMVHLCI